MKKILLLLVMNVFIFASIAQVTAIRGDANIDREGKKIPIKFGTQVEQVDTIITSATAKLQIRFEDGTIITVGKDSNISMKDYKFDPVNKENNKASFGIDKGLFKVVTGKIGKMNPDKFKLKTQTATMGIRGTELSINDKGPAGTVVGCSQGAITVTSNDTGATVPVSAGKMTDVAPGKDPAPARAYNPTELGGADEDTKEEKKEEKAEKKEEKKEEKAEAKEETKEEKADKSDVDDTEDNANSEEQKDDTAAEKEQKQDGEQTADNGDVGDEDNAQNDQAANDDGKNDNRVENEQPKEVEKQEVATQEIEQQEVATQEVEPQQDLKVDVDVGDTAGIEIEPIDVETFEVEVDTGAITDSVATVQETVATVQETVEEIVSTSETVAETTNDGYLPPVYSFDTQNLELIVEDADKLSYMEFGYWATDASNPVTTAVGPYLAGFETPDVTIEDYITVGATSTYSGDAHAIINETTQVDGTVTVTINFGAQSVTGNINITDWESTINSGTVTTGGYSSDDITGSTSGVTSGNLEGYFFGDTAQETGGSFELNKDTGDSAVGVYGATK